MRYSNITSLHSPRIEEVKALLGSRGKKLRKESKKFVIEGAQSVKEALREEFKFEDGPLLESIFMTEAGKARLEKEVRSELENTDIQIFLFNEEIAKHISETENTQGIFGIASYQNWTLHRLFNREPKRLLYLWEVQDPGNLGTIIRTAAGFDFDGILLSPNSVDIYSPKVQRSTVGAFFHIPVIPEIELNDAINELKTRGFSNIALDGNSDRDLDSAAISFKNNSATDGIALFFGNEARGLPEEIEIDRVSIPMSKKIESFNLSVAAAIGMNAFFAGLHK